VEMIVPADAIPAALTADLTGLAFNDAVKINAIQLPPNCRTVITGRDFTIATIVPPTVVEEAAPAAAPAAEKK